ncbi:MAG: GEVED domain-containing protein, partial [Alphaproteobacteria bacterium]|nr:GEVED domain-containing protein [Alphaproteobacteria bacterium]
MTAPAIPSGYAACYATSTADTYISNVTFNSISTSTGANTGSVETDNTGTVIAVDAGSSYTLSITTFDASGSAYTHGIAAFIDWNRDGDFADANETVYTTSSEVNVGTVSTTVNVPSGASEGDMMLRVVANEATGTPSATGTYSYGETEKYTVRVNPTFNYAWTATDGLDNAAIAQPTTSTTSTRTYTLTVTAGNGCTSSDQVTATVYENPVAGTLAVTDLSFSGNSDLTEAIEADAITWTNSGTANGDIQYYYEWTDNSGTSPSGAWIPWVTTNPNVWNANSSGGNMNKTLWVKTVTTSTNGCGTAESGNTWIDIRNCRAAATGATVSAGTVANMPFGETITYTAGTPVAGSFERFQYQWQGTAGAWSDWSTTNPLAYATDINAGQTLYVRSKITGLPGTPGTCADYSDPVQTFLIDCANTVSADAGADNSVCNGSSVVLSGSGTGSTVTGYSWSPSTELSSTSIAGPTSTATSTRTYTLTTTHTDGCIATDAVVVTVNEVPINSSVAISSNSTPPRNNDD